MASIVGVEWFAATVAPWVVAPHPNFSETAHRAAALLALVADLRSSELSRHQSRLDEIGGWEQEIVESAIDSQDAERQLAGASALRALILRPEIPVGARAAAGLFAVVAYSDSEDLDSAISVLDSLVSSPEFSISAMPSNAPSLSVIRASLLVQRAMRKVEVGRPQDAQGDCAAALAELEGTSDPSGFETFEVSPAIGWDATTAQVDLAAAVERRTRRLLSTLAPISDNSWVELIKARPLWLDIRSERREVAGLEASIKEQFDERFHSIDQSMRWAAEDPVLAPLAAGLLNAELSGDYRTVMVRRATFAKSLLLRCYSEAVPHPGNVVEGIRLLRRSRDRKALDHALASLRSVGPISALSRSAEVSLEIAAQSGRVSRADVATLAAAADLLTASQRRSAIRSIWRFMSDSTEIGSPRPTQPWPRLEVGWRAIADLLPDSMMDEAIASRTLALLRNSNDSPYLLTPLIYRLVKALNWSGVRRGTIELWSNWADDNSIGEFHALASAVRETLQIENSRDVVADSLDGLDLAEHVVVGFQSGHVSRPGHLTAAVNALVSELARIRADASRGSHSVGGHSGPQLSVLLAHYGMSDLWDPLIETLADPHVAATDKGRALSQLASLADDVPADVRSKLRERWAGIAEAATDPFFDDGPSPQFVGSLLRMGYRIGAISSADFIAQIMALASGSSLEKIQAIGNLAWSDLDSNMRIWSTTLGVQLSLEADPAVRSNSAFLIGRQAARYSEMADAQDRRLIELLDEDGISVPLFALNGLRSGLAESSDREIPEIEARVVRLASSHGALSVRNEAATVMQLLGAADGS